MLKERNYRVKLCSLRRGVGMNQRHLNLVPVLQKRTRLRSLLKTSGSMFAEWHHLGLCLFCATRMHQILRFGAVHLDDGHVNPFPACYLRGPSPLPRAGCLCDKTEFESRSNGHAKEVRLCVQYILGHVETFLSRQSLVS